MAYKVKKCKDNITVPRDALLGALEGADSLKFKVLFTILADPEISEDAVCDIFDITKKRLHTVISYWQKAGVLEGCEAEAPKVAKKAHCARATEMPRYTNEEIARFAENNEGFSDLLVSCQNELGKFFTMAETEILIGMMDYLNLDAAYIVLLFGHCVGKGKKSLRYIEKTAIEYVDRGILTYDELEAYISRTEKAAKMEHKLRELFGIGTRGLIKREKDAFERWSGEWNMPFEIIERAFDVTVTNTNEASVPYCNSVLERWHASGYTTIEQVEEALEQYKHKKSGAKEKKGSFETDDFFEAALARSFGNDN